MNEIEKKAVAWARPVYAKPVGAPEEVEGEMVDIEFHLRAEKPEGEGWRPLVIAAPLARQPADKILSFEAEHRPFATIEEHYECAVRRVECDEVLLRQALEALEQIARDLPWELTGLQADTIAALRLRLGKGMEAKYHATQSGGSDNDHRG